MQEIAGLLVDGFLQALLGRGIGGEITNPPSCHIKFGEGINQSLANLGSIRYLC